MIFDEKEHFKYQAEDNHLHNTSTILCLFIV